MADEADECRAASSEMCDESSSSGQSSNEDNTADTSTKKKQRTWGFLDNLHAEYDHLGTTPPRTRIRNKVKNIRNQVVDVLSPGSPRIKFTRRNTTDNVINKEATNENHENKKSKRRSLKTLRGHERDLKLDIDKCTNVRSDSIPCSLQIETSNRFLSLCSQLVKREPRKTKETQENDEKSTSESYIQNSRSTFHQTFSMLIRMRNTEKNWKRTVSMEHTWKNELKDLIWLEVSAKHAGRTPTQHDYYLLSKRETVPILLQQILDYKFENNENKCSLSGIWTTQVSVLSSDSGIAGSVTPDICDTDTNQKHAQCLCVDCEACSKAVGKAMCEVKALMDALAEAESLYTSSKSMSTQHPMINSDKFINKVKAMCLWYNMVHHQRLKILIIKKILSKHIWKESTKSYHYKIPDSDELECCKKGDIKFKKNKVKFDLTECVIKDEATSSEFIECVESDDDNDVKQSSKIHIEITKSEPKSVEATKDEENPNMEMEKLSASSPYESTDSSVGSVISNESGFASSVYDNSDENEKNQSITHTFDVYNLGSLRDLTKLRLYNPKIVSPYRDYIEKMLKVRGLRSALYFLEKLQVEVLKKARMTLEKYKEDTQSETIDDTDTPNIEPHIQNANDSNDSDNDFQYERHTRYDVDIDELKNECLELKRFGAWSEETLDMCLPSYRNTFLFLSTLPLENIHEFLAMRLETKPEKPSALSIKQLIHELREGLAIAVRLRGRFIRHVSTALMAEDDNSKHRQFYARVISTFDNTLNEVYKLYLSYLSDWATMEHLPRAPLVAEWSFNRYLAQRLYLAATISPLTFCCLTVRQLEGAAARLKTKVLELKDTAISFTSGISKGDRSNDIKLGVLKVCRDIQCLLSEERERALSTAHFARIVSKHLYHNAVFRDHRRNIYKAMACVQSVLCSIIEQLQETTTPKRLSELDELDRPSVQSRTKEIVSQGYKFGFEFHKEMYRLVNDGIASDDSMSKSRPRVQRSESIQCDAIQASMEENYFPFTPFTPTSTNSAFVYPANYKPPSKDEEALKYSLYGHKNLFKTSSHFDNEFTLKSLSELTPEDFQTGVPGCEKCNRTVFCENELNECPVKEYNSSDCDWHMVVSKDLIEFAKKWMIFAVTRCERGKGRRPRWASHGLEFLMLTCDPQHTKHLSDVEFEKFKCMMDACISHVIGSCSISASSGSTVYTPGSQRPRVSFNSSHNPFSNKTFQSVSPSTPPIENSPNLQNCVEDNADRQSRKISVLKELDCKRDANLRRAGAIGNVKHSIESRDHFRPRPVTFKWQRGIKIGQGRFGKVYTVVNIQSGQLLAMKEIGLGIGDRRAIDRAANELQILEDVVHPNLVRYYGVEIYREEMLIFMELCVEGSLESMIANCNSNSDEETGNGLPEQLIRRYTGQLVSAVRALHERSIAHRDIKSGNIFLTEGGNCLKLGDFGCAVKIRANTTVPGELQGYIGTQAYMAPEVFMKSSGHGRAADIWSLGCVVVEMASGKHPWSDCDSNYQIMYKVGTGNRPEWPSSLSQEGTDFCIACLQHDSTLRATADKLAEHHFLKVNQNDFLY
ncbi:mitogen-activated protein kinase kinase kinase 4 isoform X2 [Arctopsyche grandis]|uniref:mitogen-activated protein kinase kinase kinase 4 isoform X2 n=1 Tax=Arctopsyche grandis TaxID=121162 RepID=UPI00406D7B1A